MIPDILASVRERIYSTNFFCRGLTMVMGVNFRIRRSALFKLG